MKNDSTHSAGSAAHRLLSASALQRLQALDMLWGDGAHPNSTASKEAPPPTPQKPCAFDVALVGGGLSMLFAPLLARRNLSVVVLERALDGTPHREWNASATELQELVDLGLLTAAELAAVVVARYDSGICRWHGGATQRVHDVLDCAVDSGALWLLARAKAEAAGVTLWPGVSVTHEWPDDAGVTLRLVRHPDAAAPAPDVLRVATMVDGRGASSPYARGDLVCPTVGGVLEGLEEGQGPLLIDPKVGEILVTTEGIEAGRQHLWEAFPGHPGQVAVYLFYYAERGSLGPAPLERLYDRFASHLSRYKTGNWRLVRPTFGMIPGHSRMRQPVVSPHPRLVLVGDAAGRQSPLTFCGFGAMLRSLRPATDGIERAVRGEHHGASVVDDAPVHAITGILALMLARADNNGVDKTNALLNAAFTTLEEDGPQGMNALLQDRMGRDEAVRFLWRVGQKYKGVWPAVYKQLGPRDALRWAWRQRSSMVSLLHTR